MTLELHLPESRSLKAKRAELNSLKAHLHRRYGAAVAETDHQDRWQRATVAVALVSADHGRLEQTADAVEGFTRSRFGDWVRVDRTTVSDTDLRDT